MEVWILDAFEDRGGFHQFCLPNGTPPSQLATIHTPHLDRFVCRQRTPFLQMVANAKASGDEIAALQMRQMEMEFEMGDS